MRFYTKQHRYYCGIDLHARSMYVCILDPQGEIVLHRNMPCAPELFLKAVAPYREDMAVGVECHLYLVLARRSVRQAEYSFCSGARAVHESDPRRQGQER